MALRHRHLGSADAHMLSMRDSPPPALDGHPSMRPGSGFLASCAVATACLQDGTQRIREVSGDAGVYPGYRYLQTLCGRTCLQPS